MRIRKNTIALAAAACSLLITNASQAAVTVTWSQEGPDVVATYSGSVLPGVFLANNFTIDPRRRVSNTDFNHIIPAGSFRVLPGLHSASGLASVNATSATSGVFSFGNNNQLYLPPSAAEGVMLNVSGSLTFANRTLASMNADAFDNQLVFVTDTNDNRVFYNTVPEPGSVALCAFGAAFLLRRRRS